MNPLLQDGSPLERAQDKSREDPRTSFRQVQPQDAIIWTATLYQSYLQRIAANPDDALAREWFFCDDTATGTFAFWCRTFGQDAQAIRGHIAARTASRIASRIHPQPQDKETP